MFDQGKTGYIKTDSIAELLSTMGQQFEYDPIHWLCLDDTNG